MGRPRHDFIRWHDRPLSPKAAALVPVLERRLSKMGSNNVATLNASRTEYFTFEVNGARVVSVWSAGAPSPRLVVHKPSQTTLVNLQTVPGALIVQERHGTVVRRWDDAQALLDVLMAHASDVARRKRKQEVRL